jgi:hypothetical protein
MEHIKFGLSQKGRQIPTEEVAALNDISVFQYILNDTG